MATKPTYPKWIPGAEGARITDPGESKRALGFVYKEKPPFQYFNWALYNFSQWVVGLQGAYFDIVVGSSAQVTANEATHVLGDLNDTLVVAGSRVLILDGTHTLLANLDLGNADVLLVGESPAAIVAVSTFQILLSGARQFANLRVTGAGANDIQVSAAGSHFEGIDVAYTAVQVTNGATFRTTGASSGIAVSRITLGILPVKPVFKDHGTKGTGYTLQLDEADLHLVEFTASVTLTIASTLTNDKATVVIKNGNNTITLSGIDNDSPTLTVGATVQDFIGLVKSYGKITAVATNLNQPTT